MKRLKNIYQLGIKELRSLRHDPVLLFLVVFVFSFIVYIQATGISHELHNAPIAIVDEDSSPLSNRLINAFYGPYFKTPEVISVAEIDPGMDTGQFTFVIDIPPNFERDILTGQQPEIQVNIDATVMMQAGIGAGYIQNIVVGEITKFLQGYRGNAKLPIGLAVRMKFNPNLTGSWFTSIMAIIDYITLLAIALTGAALIREREHGTIEHLLVMPLTPFEIMTAKIWANGLVVLTAATLSLRVVVQGLLQVPIAGSVILFLFGAMLYLFSVTSMGIFLATVARSMPQLGLLVILIVLPLNMLSGGYVPRESMPKILQNIMQIAPSTHFVSLAQAILYRGAGFDVVWPNFLAIIAIGAVFFFVALARFRKTITLTQV